MDRKMIGSIVPIGALAGLVLGVVMGLLASGSDGRTADVVKGGPPHSDAASDWAFPPDANALVSRSDLIVKGELVGSEEMEVTYPDRPERSNTTNFSAKTVRVVDVLKGSPKDDIILVGQLTLGYEPQIEGTVYLFLTELDSSRLFDYVLHGGPGSHFQVRNGVMVPMAPNYVTINQQFKGASEEAFVEAIRSRISN